MPQNIEYSWETFWLGFKDWLFQKSEAKLEEEGVATSSVKVSASFKLTSILLLTFIGLYTLSMALNAGLSSSVAPSPASQVVASSMVKLMPVLLGSVILAMAYSFCMKAYRRGKSFVEDCCRRGTLIKNGR